MYFFSFLAAHLGCELIGNVLELNLLDSLYRIRKNALYNKSSYHTYKSMKIVLTPIPHQAIIYKNEDMSDVRNGRT